MELKVHNLDLINNEEVLKYLSTSSFQSIDTINWPEYNYRPKVEFSCVHNSDRLFILFKVEEEDARAEIKDNFDAVFEDSCVEFFVQVDGNNYANFEFNRKGVLIAQCGTDINNRNRFVREDLECIKTESSELHQNNGLQYWSLLVSIPIKLFNAEKGKYIGANFHKCGDKCKTPHFLSWAPIDSEKPDFHTGKFSSGIFLQ